jgi:hypothetical protein
VNSIDNFRSEAERVGEVFLELMRSELQNLRRGIVDDIAKELRHAGRKRIRHRTDQRKQAIARLLQQNSKITNVEICRAMDKLQEKSADYAPLPSWNCHFWMDAYHHCPNRVHSYINSVRTTLH